MVFASEAQREIAASPGFGRARPGLAGQRRTPLVTPVAPPSPPSPQPLLRDLPHPLAQRWDGVCRLVESWIVRHPLAPDLAEDIGSARWFRGLATMLGLGLVAATFWPSFTPLEAAPLALLDEGARAELRAQGIRPALAGATNGRHFAAGADVVRLAAAPERPSIALTATLGENDDLPHMLQRAGLGTGDAARVAALVGSAVPAGEIAPGTRFAITLGAHAGPYDPRPLERLDVRARFDLALAIRREGGGLALQKLAIPVDTTPLRLRGAAGGSLYRAARAAGAPADTVQDYLRAIDPYLSFADIAPTDEFDLVVSYKRAADGQGQAGQLLYAGVLRDGKPRLQLLRWGADGGFMTPDAFSGAPAQNDSAALGAPVAGHITSGFGLRRHPILGYVRMHAGVDFAAAWGSPVYAVTDGTVSYAGWHGGHGNYVRLDHGGGLGSGYGHMSRLAVGPGASVRRGQVIGYVGSTGLSTGPHLHYEVYRGGQVVDPLSVRMAVRRQVVDTAQRDAFRARLNGLLALHAGAAVAHPR